jgi:hypothetical protein
VNRHHRKVGTVAHPIRARTTQDLLKFYTKKLIQKGHSSAVACKLGSAVISMNPSQLPEVLLAPHEYAIHFNCTAGELSYTPDSIRYLGVLALGEVSSATAG